LWSRQLQLGLLRLSEQPLRHLHLAKQFGVTSRTLSNWARRDGFDGIGAFVSKCRILQAIGWAERAGSVEAVALALGFGSASHLANMVRRHTGMSLRAALKANSFEGWCGVILGGGLSDIG
jgi:AraC-like DNA-binding protein